MPSGGGNEVEEKYILGGLTETRGKIRFIENEFGGSISPVATYIITKCHHTCADDICTLSFPQKEKLFNNTQGHLGTFG